MRDDELDAGVSREVCPGCTWRGRHSGHTPVVLREALSSTEGTRGGYTDGISSAEDGTSAKPGRASSSRVHVHIGRMYVYMCVDRCIACSTAVSPSPALSLYLRAWPAARMTSGSACTISSTGHKQQTREQSASRVDGTREKGQKKMSSSIENAKQRENKKISKNMSPMAGHETERQITEYGETSTLTVTGTLGDGTTGRKGKRESIFCAERKTITATITGRPR